ncbi:MAG: TOMM precursor leader peptide-binding protein [Bryobacteraceae bacterium]
MPTLKYKNPRLPSHFYVLFEPPGSDGEEVLRFVSERRRIKLKGHSFREFQEHVIPLLDGRHSIQEIEERVSDVFRPQDLEDALQLLAEQNLLEDASESGAGTEEAALEPQSNFLREVSPDPKAAQEKLNQATIVCLGLGGPGAAVALALAGAGVGSLRCLDALEVAPADLYLSPVYSKADVGMPRAEALRRRIAAASPGTRVTSNGKQFDSDADVREAVAGADFVVCCLDAGQSSLIYKLNRVCLAEKIPWTSCAVTGMEVVVGPTVIPDETACFLCYKMRAVACAEDSEADFAFQRLLDRRKLDDSGKRENLNFAAGIAANLLGLEVFKLVSGAMPSPTVGRIAVFDLIALSLKKHVVLRKPWCPACFPQGNAG